MSSLRSFPHGPNGPKLDLWRWIKPRFSPVERSNLPALEVENFPMGGSALPHVGIPDRTTASPPGPGSGEALLARSLLRGSSMNPETGNASAAAEFPEVVRPSRGVGAALPLDGGQASTASGRPVDNREGNHACPLHLSDEVQWHRDMVWRLTAADFATYSGDILAGARRSGSRNGLVFPILLVAAVSILGYLTASRSASALRDGWRQLDEVGRAQETRTAAWLAKDAEIGKEPVAAIPAVGGATLATAVPSSGGK